MKADCDFDFRSGFEEAHGCIMCHSLYVKANGEMPCWDDVGEGKILRHLDYEALLNGEEKDLFYSPDLLAIRKAYSAGQEPFPELCLGCAARGHGAVGELRPDVIEILHIEASYLCHLACPQCIPPKARRTLKGPPYNIPAEVYECLLRSLLRDGVEQIRFVHFEGRGDPLMNPGLGKMIRATKELYPYAFTKVTTHGNYPFRPWILDSGLDLLRLSIDGAFPETYSTYRVGGSLDAALDLMRNIRDLRRSTGASLRMEWKYLLFEWNDSDEEMLEAARLADEVDADLRFCLTHSPGRSNRIPDLTTLGSQLTRLGIDASPDLTFQLKPDPSNAYGDAVVGEHCEALLHRALRLLRSGDTIGCSKHLNEALRLDPGVDWDISGDWEAGLSIDRLFLDAEKIRHPSTASALANIAFDLQEAATAEVLFRRYLAMAPTAPDREKVDELLVRLIVENRLGRSTSEMSEAAMSELLEAQKALLEFDPGPALLVPARTGRAVFRRALPELAEAVRSPRTLVHLAHLRWFQGDPLSAIRLSERFVELSHCTEDHLQIKKAVQNFRRFRWRCRLLYLGRLLHSRT
jgi:hypothetical protein